MNNRLKVLISAYACEHGKGSEPEVGWQWCMQMARFHDVTVLTRANNRPNIEAALAALPSGQPVPRFTYFDSGPFLLAIKSKFNITRLYYMWWQRAVRKRIAELCRNEKFDLLHHATMAGFRYSTGIWGHGVPSIWGPVGGMASLDWRLLPYRRPYDLLVELGRSLNNVAQSISATTFRSRARQSRLIVACNVEAQNCLAQWHLPSKLMPTIGLDMADFPPRADAQPTGPRPLRLLFVGQLIWLKGVDLAVEALAASGTDATLHFIGAGPFRQPLEKLATKLGLAQRVTFSPHIPRAQVMREMYGYDVFIFPSLHDSGGFAVLEAMASEMPVICLDAGGPAISVAEGCGYRIPIGPRKAVIAGLAERIQFYASNREAARRDGQRARLQVATNFNWDRKGEQMNALYLEVAKPAK